MSHEDYRIAIAVRTRDVESCLQELLLKLSRQTVDLSELVVVDNFSSKKSLEEMQRVLSSAKRKLFDNRIPVKLVPIMNNEFSHSYSTNIGVSVADGDLICIINGHSLPSSPKWLEIGVAHFKSPKVAGVGGYFTAHEDGTTWEKLGYDWWWKRRNEITKAYVKDNYFSTVNCIFRKSLWEKYPFDEKLPNEIPYAGKFGGEDYDWAEEMQARGYRIVVDPRFNVCHSHKETIAQLILKYMVWRRIRKRIKSFKRPRKSYTRLERVKPSHYDL
jgi:glycosyltransferase involved in cell wall biosynthesis